MHKLIYTLVFLFLCSISFGQELPTIGKQLEGTHLLNYINYKKPNETHYYFMTTDDFSSKVANSKTLWFMWQNNNKEYTLSQLPLSKVTITFSVDVTTPTIKFQWISEWKYPNMTMMYDIMKYQVTNAVITLRVEDWNINLNPIDKPKGVNIEKDKK